MPTDPSSKLHRAKFMAEKVSTVERTAEVQNVEYLTLTGTVRLTFQIIGNLPFHFEPGQCVSFGKPAYA